MKNKKLSIHFGVGLAVIVLAAVSFLAGKAISSSAAQNTTITVEMMDEYLETVPQEVKDTIQVYMVKMLEENDGLENLMTAEMKESLCESVSRTILEENLLTIEESEIINIINEKFSEVIMNEVEKQVTTQVTEIVNNNNSLTMKEINNISETVKEEILAKLDGYATEEQVSELISQAVSNKSEDSLTSKEVQNIINETIKSNSYMEYITKNVTGLNGKDGKDGRDGKDGYTPVKGVDYFTESDIEQIAERTATTITDDYMTTIVTGVVQELMEEGNITLSTFEQDIIDKIVNRLMEESTSSDYIKEQVLESVQSMLVESMAKPFVPGNTYYKGEAVTYNGNLYVVTSDSTTSNPSDTANWQKTTITELLSNLTDLIAELEAKLNESVDDFQSIVNNRIDGNLSVIEQFKVIDAAQDTLILAIQEKNAEQDTLIEDIKQKEVIQNEMLSNILVKDAAQDEAIKSIQDKDAEQEERLSALERAEYSFVSDGNGSGTVRLTYKATSNN